MKARFSQNVFPIEFDDPANPGDRKTVKVVHLVDSDDGAMTITNDAEEVVRHLLRTFSGHRFFYTDTDGNLDELKHDGERFTGFGPGPGRFTTGINWAGFFETELGY